MDNRTKTTFIVTVVALASFMIAGTVALRNFNNVLQENRALREEREALKEQCVALGAELAVSKSRLEESMEATIEVTKRLEAYAAPVEFGSAPAPMYDIPLSEEFQQYTYDICQVYGIEDHYELVLAIMWQESNYTFDVVSPTNDYGIMQINIINHEYFGKVLGIVDFLDPESNIHAGVWFLSTLLESTTDYHLVLMSYNMGPSRAAAMWDRGIYSTQYSQEALAKLELLTTTGYQ